MKKSTENWLSMLNSDLDNIPNPCYVLDEKKFIKNMELLSYVQQASGAKILCALKGFSLWNVFPLMKNYITGCTSSSVHESRLVFEEFGDLSHACFVTINYEELNEIERYNSHLTVNSINQYKKLENRGDKLSFGLRINPGYSPVETDIYNPAKADSRLGVPIDELPDELPGNIEGIHVHNLCESNADGLEKTLEILEEKCGHLLHKMKWVNLGGGHHITRADYDVELLIELVSNLRANYNVEVYLEPGEAIGWQTGFLLSRVEDIVENGGVKTAILNVSFTCHMPDCLEMPYKPAVRNESETGGFEYVFGGPTCLAGDFVKGFKFDQPLKIGDQIIFEDMMHYTFVKSNTFNGMQLPSLGKITTEGKFELIKSFGYNDYKSRLS